MRIIAGEWRGRRIAAPPGRETRPTADRVREAWMSIVAPHLPGARVLDLYAGSGALGLEALSRGAVHATFVERAPAVRRVLEANLARLGAGDRAGVATGDALRFVRDLEPGSYDLAFADPPYGGGDALRLAERFVASPFAAVLSIEHGRAEPLPAYPASFERRYGDTLLTFLFAHDEH